MFSKQYKYIAIAVAVPSFAYLVITTLPINSCYLSPSVAGNAVQGAAQALLTVANCLTAYAVHVAEGIAQVLAMILVLLVVVIAFTFGTAAKLTSLLYFCWWVAKGMVPALSWSFSHLNKEVRHVQLSDEINTSPLS